MDLPIARRLPVTLLVAATLTLIIAPPAQANGRAAATTRSCATIVFTPQSGDGLFNIRVQNISCRAARHKLRRSGGDPKALTGWSCRRTRRYEIGSSRYRCTSRALVRGRMRTRVIAYDTGN